MTARCIDYSARRLEQFLDQRPRVMKTVTRWLVSGIVLAALVWLIAGKIDGQEFLRAIRLADWPLVAGAVILAGSCCMGGLILRLYALLQALPHRTPVGQGELASIQFAL